MKIKYLSYNQAESLAIEYQFLINRPFNTGGDGEIVTGVLIAPYSRILQWDYIRQLKRGRDWKEALAICRDGRFDVLVLSDKAFETQPYRVKALRDYLAEHSMWAN